MEVYRNSSSSSSDDEFCLMAVGLITAISNELKKAKTQVLGFEKYITTEMWMAIPPLFGCLFFTHFDFFSVSYFFIFITTLYATILHRKIKCNIAFSFIIALKGLFFAGIDYRRFSGQEIIENSPYI